MCDPETSPQESAGFRDLRWPIRLQLLLPMVAVVLAASFSATAITAGWLALRVRTEQAESLRRMAETLAEATYPLSRPVLVQLRGLSGADFVLISAEGKILSSTFSLNSPIPQEQIQQLVNLVAGGAQTIRLGTKEYLLHRVSLSRRGSARPDALIILYPEDQMLSRVRQAVYPALIAGVAATVIALLISAWLARRLARPLAQLAARTAEIARGNFASMPLSHRNDELRDLAESINRMAEQLADYEQQVRRQEQMKTVERLGAALAHQLRNAAAGGRMAIELHRRECPAGATDESLEVALRQLRRLESCLRQFLAVEQFTPAAREHLNAAELVEDVLRLLRPSCVHAGIELKFTAPSKPLFLAGDAEALHQLITNLVTNGIEAASGDRTVAPQVVVKVAKQGDNRGVISVFDTGRGPPESIRNLLFASFVSTKPEGFGLGLFVARQIAERHGGRLCWRREGDRTCFSFEFPLAANPAQENAGKGSEHGARIDC